MDAARLIRQARLESGVTQVELARRLGVTQPTVAALERPGSNPTMRTLARAIEATDHRLQMLAPAWALPFDPSLVREQLKLTATERMRGLERLQHQAQVYGSARRAG